MPPMSARSGGPILTTLECLRAAPRCGARTRSGTPCMSPAAHGKGRCRMHGGALGSGAPIGNRNAWKHGYWSAAEGASRSQMADLLRTVRDLCKRS